MDIEKIPSIIEGMQKDISFLKSEISAVKGERIEHKAEISASKQEIFSKFSYDLAVMTKDEKVYYIDNIPDEIELEDVDGIVLPLLDRRLVLVYPKFKDNCKLLPDGADWKAPKLSECEALYYEGNGEQETTDLLALGSEAAKYVRNVADHRKFNLPFNLQVLFALHHYKAEFNELVKHIEGADEYNPSYAWSSCRYNTNNAWNYNNNGNTNNNNFYNGLTAVPCVN